MNLKRKPFSLWVVMVTLHLGLLNYGHASPFRSKNSRSTAAQSKNYHAKSGERRQLLKRIGAVATLGLEAVLSRRGSADATSTRRKSIARKGFDKASQELRIVTTTPSGTELVDALGQSHRLVGVDDYTTYPESTRQLPRVGDVVNPDIDAIAALKPALVVLDAEQTELQSRGIETLVVKMETISDVDDALTKLGRVLGKSEDALKARARMDTARVSRHQGNARDRVLVVLERSSSSENGWSSQARTVISASSSVRPDSKMRSMTKILPTHPYLSPTQSAVDRPWSWIYQRVAKTTSSFGKGTLDLNAQKSDRFREATFWLRHLG